MTELAPSYVLAPSRWTMPHDVRGLALTPDGARVWAFDFVGNVWLFDLATGSVVRVLRTPKEPGGYEIALDPSGTWLAFAPGNAPAELWNTVTGEARVLPSKHPAFSVGFSSDGARLIVGGARFVSCYELRGEDEPRCIKLKAHSAQAFAVALRDKGHYGVSLGYDGAKEHSILTGQATSEAFGLTGRARLDAGARFVVDSMPDTLLVRDLVKGQTHMRAPLPTHDGRKWALHSIARDASRAFSSDHVGRRLLCVDIPAHAQREGAPPACVELPLHWIAPHAVLPLPDGTLLVAGTTADAFHSGGVLAVLDSTTGAIVRGPEPGASRTTALLLHGDALWVASADRTLVERSLEDGTVRGVRHLAEGSIDALYADAAGAPTYARVRTPGAHAAVVRTRDLGTALEVPGPTSHTVRNTVHAPSQTFVGIGADLALVALSLDDGAERMRARFERSAGGVAEVYASADGARCVVAGLEDAQVFSLADGGAALATFIAKPRGFPEACALSRDGRFFVNPTTKGQHFVWDTTKGRKARTLKPDPAVSDPLLQTTATALDPTDRYLVTAMSLTGCAELWLWELVTGARLAVLALGPHGVVTKVAMSEGGALLVAGTSTGAVVVWKNPMCRPA